MAIKKKKIAKKRAPLRKAVAAQALVPPVPEPAAPVSPLFLQASVLLMLLGMTYQLLVMDKKMGQVAGAFAALWIGFILYDRWRPEPVAAP
jgi:hypothetical protein